MGLDMYLTGERYFHSRDDTKQPLVGERYRLGYWRKHPNLHGYIVQTFAKGVDECQEIPLSRDFLRKILSAITSEQLPSTSGFFFGESNGTEKQQDLKTFKEALAWLATPDEEAWRSIIYQASW